MPPQRPKRSHFALLRHAFRAQPGHPDRVALALTQGESVNEAVERCWNGGTISRSKSGVA